MQPVYFGTVRGRKFRWTNQGSHAQTAWLARLAVLLSPAEVFDVCMEDRLMRMGMCNEFCQGWSLDETFKLAKAEGYEGVELAPFTLGTSVEHITAETKAQVHEAAARHGLQVIGLHWLLAKTHGRHITHR